MVVKRKKKSAVVRSAKRFVDTKVFCFDLDGTLTESKAELEVFMARLIRELLQSRKVVIVGGGNVPQFKKQFLRHLACTPQEKKNLFLMPTSGASMYKFSHGKLINVYRHELSLAEKQEIRQAFKDASHNVGFVPPKKTYGPIMEDRGTQITFSLVGQRAPVRVKREWNKRFDSLRKRLRTELGRKLENFEVRTGGMTSLDITKKGIDKGYGMEQLMKRLHISLRDMVYVGDALYKGGNDYAVVRTGVPLLKVRTYTETGEFLRRLHKLS